MCRSRGLAEAVMLASLADETPEGRSIVVSGDEPLRPDGARHEMPDVADRAFLRSHQDFGCRSSRTRAAQRRGRFQLGASRAARGSGARGLHRGQSSAFPVRAARRSLNPRMNNCSASFISRTSLSRISRTVRGVARHGHQDGHGDGRQSNHGGGHRRRGGRRRFHRAGDARG